MSQLNYNNSEEDINCISQITKESNFGRLSHNRYLNLDWLQKFPNANWNYHVLTRRYNFNKIWFYALPDKPWDLELIFSSQSFTLKEIITIPDMKIKLDFPSLSSNPDLSLQWLQHYPDEDWDLQKLSRHPNFCLEWFNLFPVDRWDFQEISKNKTFPLCILDDYPDADWDFQEISYHQKLNCYWFAEFKDRDWDFEFLQNKYIFDDLADNMNQEMLTVWVVNFPEDKHDFEKLSDLIHLSLEMLQAFPLAPWNFQTISNRHIGKYLKWTRGARFIEKSWLELFPQANWDPNALIQLSNFDLSWTLVSPHLDWKFNKISYKLEDITYDFIKRFPDNSLNNTWLKTHPYLNETWLQFIPQTPENYKKLSYHKLVDLNWLTTYPDAPWDWKILSCAPKLDVSWLERFPEKTWNFSELSDRVNLDILALEILPHSPWVFSSLSYNKNLTLRELQQYGNRDWNFMTLSSHPNCDLTWLQAFPDKISQWHFPSLSKSKKLKLEWLQAYPDADWDYQVLSHHNRFNKQWYLTAPYADWELGAIAIRKDMKKLMPLLQYNYPHVPILMWFHNLSLSDSKAIRNLLMSVILLNTQNYQHLPIMNQGEFMKYDILRKASFTQLSDVEKANVLEVEKQKIITYDIHPDLFFNPTTDLELTDLSGDSFWIPGWFQSNNIMELIHQTLPDLGNIDIYVESFTDKPDQLGSQTYNLHLKYLLFNQPNGPQAMIVYPEKEE